VYLQDKGVCDIKWPRPALTNTTLEVERYFLRYDLTTWRAACQEFADL